MKYGLFQWWNQRGCRNVCACRKNRSSTTNRIQILSGSCRNIIPLSSSTGYNKKENLESQSPSPFWNLFSFQNRVWLIIGESIIRIHSLWQRIRILALRIIALISHQWSLLSQRSKLRKINLKFTDNRSSHNGSSGNSCWPGLRVSSWKDFNYCRVLLFKLLTCSNLRPTCCYYLSISYARLLYCGSVVEVAWEMGLWYVRHNI